MLRFTVTTSLTCILLVILLASTCAGSTAASKDDTGTAPLSLSYKDVAATGSLNVSDEDVTEAAPVNVSDKTDQSGQITEAYFSKDSSANWPELARLRANSSQLSADEAWLKKTLSELQLANNSSSMNIEPSFSTASTSSKGYASGPPSLCGSVPSSGGSQKFSVTESAITFVFSTVHTMTQSASTDVSIATERPQFVRVSLTTQRPQLVTESNTLSEVGHDSQTSKEIVSAELYLKAKTPLEDITTAFNALALVINLINVVVLSQKSMRNPSSAYLLALSLTELTYVTLALVPVVYNTISPLLPTSRFYLTYGLYMLNYVSVVLGRFTYFLTTMVCTERFFALVFPLKASRSRLIRSPPATILVSAAVILLCHFHIALKYEVYPAVVLDDGHTLYAFRFTQIFVDNRQILEMWALMIKVLFVYAMLFLGLVVNIMLVVALHRHRRSRQKMTTSDDADKRKRQEREITLTILVSSMVFTALGLPLTTNSMAAQLAPHGSYGFFSAQCHTFLFVQLVGGAAFALSFCTDFCTFVLFSSAYRTTLRHVAASAALCRKWVKVTAG